VTHLGPFVHERDLAVAEHVAEVRDDLGSERDEEPDRLDVLHPVPDRVEARHLAQGEEGGQREERGRHEEHRRLHPRSVQMTLGLDVQVTQGTILR